MGSDQHFCLRWNNFHTNIAASFEHLRDHEEFVDVTLACEGRSLKAHKVVLSACSPYFKSLLKQNPCQHPIIILRDVAFPELSALLNFVYQGEVYVSQDRLTAFLRTAEMLHIKGLTEQTQHHQSRGGTSLSSTSLGTPSSTTIFQAAQDQNLSNSKVVSSHTGMSMASPPSQCLSPHSPSMHAQHLPVHISPPPKKRRPTTSTGSNSPSPPSMANSSSDTISPHLESSTLAAALSKPPNPSGNPTTCSGNPQALPSVLSIALTQHDLPKVKKEEEEEVEENMDELNEGDVISQTVPLMDQAVNLVTEGSILRKRIQGYQGQDVFHPISTGNGRVQVLQTHSVMHSLPHQDDSSVDDSFLGRDGDGEMSGEGEQDREVLATSPMVIRSPLVGLLPREGSGPFGGAGTSGSLAHHDSPQEDNPYEARPCPVCHKLISNRANLKKHLKIRHSVQEEVLCPHCRKLFRNKYSLWTHINSYHPGVKVQQSQQSMFHPHHQSQAHSSTPQCTVPLYSVRPVTLQSPSQQEPQTHQVAIPSSNDQNRLSIAVDSVSHEDRRCGGSDVIRDSGNNM